MTLTRTYLNCQKKYEETYGCEKTIVFMQVGSFHEAYATLAEGQDLFKISEILNIVCTRKDKSNNDINESNPYLVGFPTSSKQKYLRILMEHGYTVIIIDQVTNPPKPKRKITGIFSPGTYIENLSYDSNNIVSLYIEEEEQSKGYPMICIGMTSIDLTTGQCCTHEAYGTSTDTNFSLDEAYRFINNFNPKEIIVCVKNLSDDDIFKKKIISYLELDGKLLHYRKIIDDDKLSYKISWQNEFLKTIFNIDGMITSLELLDLDRMIYGVLSLIFVLKYAKTHDENIIKNIRHPRIFQDNQHVIIGNDAVSQLNIISSTVDIGTAKYGSLFDVVNHTTTAVGRRLLKERLILPSTNYEELNEIYDFTEKIIELKLDEKINFCLKEISDIERLHRRMELNLMHPFELFNFISSYKSYCNMCHILKENGLYKFVIDEKTEKKITKFINKCDELFDMDNLKKCNLTDMTISFFNKGVYDDIDETQNNIDQALGFMDKLSEILSEIIDKNGRVKIKVKYNERDGHHISLTKTRAILLQKKLKSKKMICVCGMDIRTEDLIFKDLIKGNTKIFYPHMNDKSHEIDSLKIDLANMVIEKYTQHLNNFAKKYNNLFMSITSSVAMIDFIISNAITAKKYNYVRPIIDKQKYGYIECTNLRHPIIERIIDYDYVGHDIILGKDVKGMIVFGINSSGKSSLMKEVGLSIFMAQSGMFVPANSFTYSPYKSLYTRITACDNIFKGQSSFTLEMTELKSIISRANKNTLVIGDELCRGTEFVSAMSLVASSVIKLSTNNVSFIFASHLSGLVQLDEIKSLDNIKIFHLTVDYDDKTNALIFDRKLKDGPTKDVYGITVAKYIINDDDFIKCATKISDKLLNKSKKIYSDKISKYNSEVYVDHCMICGTTVKSEEIPLDTHHIKQQKDFPKYQNELKNSKKNLIVLCKKCHQQIHDGDVLIEGYVATTKGKQIKIKNYNVYN